MGIKEKGIIKKPPTSPQEKRRSSPNNGRKGPLFKTTTSLIRNQIFFGRCHITIPPLSISNITPFTSNPPPQIRDNQTRHPTPPPFLSQAAIDKLRQSDYGLHLFKTTKGGKGTRNRGFEIFHPTSFNINTVSTSLRLSNTLPPASAS